MAIQTHLAAAKLLKTVYFPGITDQLNNETPGLSILRRIGKEKWSGAQVNLATRIARNRSSRPTSSANEAAALPAAGKQGYDNFEVPCVLIHGSGGLTAFGAAATRGSESAFADMLKSEVDVIVADAKKDREIDFFGTPLGVLAQVTAAGGGGGATITLGDTQALVAWTSHGNRYFSPDMLIDLVRVDGSALTNGTIESAATGVPTANRNTILTTADVATNNDLVVRRGTISAGAGGNAQPGFAWSGLEYLIDDTTTAPAAAAAGGYEFDKLQGIDRGSNAYAQSTVVDLNNVELARNDLHNLVYQIEERGAAYPDVFLTHRSVQLAIADLMVGDQRYQPQELPGGFKADALLFNAGSADIPILVARECPYDRLYALDLDAIEMFVLQDFEMIETDGSVLRQDSGGGDAWNFSYRHFANIASRAPNRLGKMVRIGGADESFGAGAGRLYDF